MKLITLALCLTGAVMIFLGMSRQGDMLFSLGIAALVAGYVLIRRRLKKSLEESRDSIDDRRPGS
jgi:hypothetical protein